MVLPLIALFILGTIFGSFLSVINYRIRHKKKGILFGRSQCNHCHKNLKFYQLIPIFSYIIGGGKCMSCKKKIHISYPLLELACGLLLAGLYFYIPFNNFDFSLLNYSYLAFVGLCLIGIFFYDIRYFEIPEIYTFSAIAITFLWGIFSPTITLYEMAIGGGLAAVFFGFQVIASKEKWLGAGDTQVGILMGLLLGWKLFLVSLVVTYLFGLIITIILLATKKVKRNSKIPFAPFLVTGTFITIFFGNYILELYLNTLL